MDFKDIVQKRYAAKAFSDEKVSEGDFDKLLEMTKMAASSFGIQPYIIYTIKDQALLEKLQAASWNQAQIGTCSHLLVFCALKDVSERVAGYEALMKQAGAPQEKIDGYLGVIRGFMERMSPEETLNWSAKQAYIALDVAMSAVTELGLDSCPMEGFISEDYMKILNLPENHVPVVLLPIGYASDEPKPKIRFSKEDLFKRLP